MEFGITQLYFSGVAGAIHQELYIGDIVVANSLVQHDMVARPIMKQFEISLLGETVLCTLNWFLKKSIERVKRVCVQQYFT